MVEKKELVELAVSEGVVFSEQTLNMLMQTNEPLEHARRLIAYFKRTVQQSISGGTFVQYYNDYSSGLIK